jgi:hypothetical protein
MGKGGREEKDFVPKRVAFLLAGARDPPLGKGPRPRPLAPPSLSAVAHPARPVGLGLHLQWGYAGGGEREGGVAARLGPASEELGLLPLCQTPLPGASVPTGCCIACVPSHSPMGHRPLSPSLAEPGASAPLLSAPFCPHMGGDTPLLSSAIPHSFFFFIHPPPRAPPPSPSDFANRLLIWRALPPSARVRARRAGSSLWRRRRRPLRRSSAPRSVPLSSRRARSPPSVRTSVPADGRHMRNLPRGRA